MILITGAAGLAGRATVRLLVERGCPVRAFDLVPNADPARSGVESRTGDLRDPEVCRKAVYGVSAVVHLAAVQFHTPGMPRFGLERYFARNVEMTRRLLEAAVAARVPRFVFLSSSMVYGVPSGGALHEDGTPRPAGPYGRSKVACEEHCRAAAGAIASVVILRPGVVLGPGRLGLLRRLFDRVSTHRPLPILGDGANRHSTIAVDDLAEACHRALARDGCGTYNLGAPHPSTVRDLLTDLCRRAGSRSRPLPLPAGAARAALALLWTARLSPMNPEQFLIAPRDCVLDTSAARAGLGFEARTSDRDALFAAYRWYLSSQVA